MKNILFTTLFIIISQLSWSVQTDPCSLPNPPPWCTTGGGPCDSPNPPPGCNSVNVPISTHDWILILAGTTFGILIILKMNKKKKAFEIIDT
jgi:hypothetical protein